MNEFYHYKCDLCGRPIETGERLIINGKPITFYTAPWFVTEYGHYGYCSKCLERLKQTYKQLKSEIRSEINAE